VQKADRAKRRPLQRLVCGTQSLEAYPETAEAARRRPGRAGEPVEKPGMKAVLERVVLAAFFAILFGGPALAIELTPAAPPVLIPVRLTERLSSQDAQSGQRFGIETTRAVKIGDVDLPSGTKGHGVVEIAQSARGQKPGKLVLAMRSLDLPDGRAIAVNFSLADPPKSDDAQGAPVSLGKGLVTIGGYASSGTNVVYEKGAPFTVTPLGANDFQPAPSAS
jgi:hypothetical protein